MQSASCNLTEIREDLSCLVSSKQWPIPRVTLPLHPPRSHFPVLTHPYLLGWDRGEKRSVGLLPALQVILGSSQGARQTIVVVDTLDTVVRVDVLDQSDLVAGGTTRAGNDGGIGQEEFPDLPIQKSARDNQ